MLHSLIIEVKNSFVNKVKMRKCLMETNVIYSFDLVIDHI